MELRDGVSGVGGDNPQADDEDNSSGACQLSGDADTKIATYGARPIAARVAGSERTPSDTDSAIMTEEVSWKESDCSATPTYTFPLAWV